MPAAAAALCTPEFVNRLETSLNDTRQLLLDERCLSRDLQFMLSYEGDIFHIDLDRTGHCKRLARLSGEDWEARRRESEDCLRDLKTCLLTPSECVSRSDDVS